MKWPIYLFGIIMLVLGGGIVVNPEIVRKMIDFIDGIKARIYAIGVLRVVLGALLAASSANAKLPGFVLILGIIIILGGISCFAIPYNKLTKFMAWYRDRSVAFNRVLGILALILGSVLLFAC